MLPHRLALFVRCLRRGRLGELLEARIIPERIEHWIESEQRRSERRMCGEGASYGIESSFSRVKMERSGSPTRAA